MLININGKIYDSAAQPIAVWWSDQERQAIHAGITNDTHTFYEMDEPQANIDRATTVLQAYLGGLRPVAKGGE